MARKELNSYFELDPPEEWENSLVQSIKNQVLAVNPIDINSANGKELTAIFKQTLPQATVLEIKMIQNHTLWKQYKNERYRIATLNGGNSNTSMLWHGTSSTPPDTVINSGFNINYSNDGMWGKAIYFAVNANYSCPSYSFKVPN